MKDKRKVPVAKENSWIPVTIPLAFGKCLKLHVRPGASYEIIKASSYREADGAISQGPEEDEDVIVGEDAEDGQAEGEDARTDHRNPRAMRADGILLDAKSLAVEVATS